MNYYILLDSAIVPDIWQFLAFDMLSFEPLYRKNSEKIKAVIPYIIQLDKLKNKKLVHELLTNPLYHSGVIIKSRNTLTELADKLGYFYQVINKNNEPCLQRFFELNVFPDFISDLPENYRIFLFSDETVFYYLDEYKGTYHKLAYINHFISATTLTIDDVHQEIL